MRHALSLDCPRCRGDRVVHGRLGSQGLRFIPDQINPFVLSFSTPYITVESTAWICLDCGLLWTGVDAIQAREKLRTWGTEELKSRTRLEQSAEISPSTPPEGRGDEAAPASGD